MEDLPGRWFTVCSPVFTNIHRLVEYACIFSAAQGRDLIREPLWIDFRTIPRVQSREPLWIDGDRGDRIAVDQVTDRDQITYELGDRRRETLSTTVLAAEPDHRYVLPGPSIWPFLLALAVCFTLLGAIAHIALVPIGAILSFLVLAGWRWPSREEESIANLSDELDEEL
jgi:hypothetical protein